MKTANKNTEIYEKVKNQILAQLEKGTAPWQKTWSGGTEGMPINYVSKKHYKGINVFLLMAPEFDSNYWLTFNQAKQLGGKVKKGEKASFVIYWNWVYYLEGKKLTEQQVRDLNKAQREQVKKVGFLRYYNVFNTAQIEGVDFKIEKPVYKPFEAIENCEAIVNNMPNKPNITHTQQRAFYSPTMDYVNMPKPESFVSEPEYYGTLFHELVHSTGHETRLGRFVKGEMNHFGSEKYSKEELVAEMGSAFICGVAGIDNQVIENSSAYIAGWKKYIKENDASILVNTAAQAAKAANYILNEN